MSIEEKKENKYLLTKNLDQININGNNTELIKKTQNQMRPTKSKNRELFNIPSLNNPRDFFPQSLTSVFETPA